MSRASFSNVFDPLKPPFLDTNGHDHNTNNNTNNNNNNTPSTNTNGVNGTNGANLIIAPNGNSNGNGNNYGVSRSSSSMSSIDSPSTRVTPLTPIATYQIPMIVATPAPSSAPTPLPFVRTVTAVLIAGFLFGVGLERSAVFQPDVIRDQLVFQRWLMMKIFLSATAAGQITLGLISLIAPEKWNAARSYTSSSTLSIYTPVLGGLILGAGMSVAGACPGMVLVQLGAGSSTAGYTILGGFIGAFIYIIIQPYLKFDAHTLYKAGNAPCHRTMDADIKLPFRLLALVMFACMIAVIGVLEHFFPWTSELVLTPSQMLRITEAQSASGTDWFVKWYHAPHWSPIVCGAIIGVAQMPLVLAMGRTMGASSCYVTIVSAPIPEKTLSRHNMTLASMIGGGGLRNWWQPLFLLFATLSGLANAAAGGIIGDVRTLPVHECIIGGILLIIGARIAGGCPSGHGLSGMPFLSTRAFGAVAGMFTGGYLVGLAVNYPY